jgi:hypothetical protein
MLLAMRRASPSGRTGALGSYCHWRDGFLLLTIRPSGGPPCSTAALSLPCLGGYVISSGTLVTESPGEVINTEALHCGATSPRPKSYYNAVTASVS